MTTSMALAIGVTVSAGTSANAATHDPIFMSFEANDVAGAAASGFSQAEGSIAAIDAAPGGNPTGESGNAFKFEKTGDPWSGINLLLPSLNTGIALTDGTHPTIEMDYYSSASDPSPVTLKLEKVGLWASEVTQEAAPGWNHLTFDFSQNANWAYAFSDGPHPEFDTLALFPNFITSSTDYTYTGAPVVSGGTYYVDNVSINGGAQGDEITAPPVPRVSTSLSLTFETDDARGANAVGASSGDHWGGAFEGGGTAIEDAIAGGNGGKALKFTKGAVTNLWPCNGPCYWSGINLLKVADDNNIRLTDADHKLITMNFYNPLTTASPVTLKLGTNVVVVRQADPGWSKLSFDVSDDADWSASTEYTELALLINWNDLDQSHGDSSVEHVYYIDNVGINGGTTPEIPSSNANLSALTLSSGTLTPAFDAARTTYTASVLTTVASLNVTATKADSGASLTIKGAAATSGTAKAVALAIGANSIPVVVTAANGSTKTYTITVTRAIAKAVKTVDAKIVGTAKKAKVLTGTAATFTGTSVTKTNQWYRCTAVATAVGTSIPGTCTAIAGKTGTSYTLTTSDVGKYIRFGSKATNSAGVTISLSKSTVKVVK